jgi:hypothetical protein
MKLPGLFNLFARDTTTPAFFYTTEPTCVYEGVSLAANQTSDGSLCAVLPNLTPPVVFGCPAPDPVCWTYAPDCTGKNSTTPGTDQFQCNNGGPDLWCCPTETLCTTTFNQINVCWGKFANPNSGVPPQAAQSIASIAMAASSSSAVASRLSALSATLSNTVTSSTASSSSGSSSSGTTTATGAGGGPTETNSASGSSSHGLSGGAIAGIVIGAIAVLALIVTVLLLLMSRRKKGVYAYRSKTYEADSNAAQTYEADSKPAQPVQPAHTDYYRGEMTNGYDDNKAHVQNHVPFGELPGDTGSTEMHVPNGMTK